MSLQLAIDLVTILLELAWPDPREALNPEIPILEVRKNHPNLSPRSRHVLVALQQVADRGISAAVGTENNLRGMRVVVLQRERSLVIFEPDLILWFDDLRKVFIASNPVAIGKKAGRSQGHFHHSQQNAQGKQRRSEHLPFG